VNVLVSKVGEATDYGKVTVESLSRLETMIGIPKSLSSIASAVSRIESLVSEQFQPPSPALPALQEYSYSPTGFDVNPSIESSSPPSSPSIITSSVQKGDARFDPEEQFLQKTDELNANATESKKIKHLRLDKARYRIRKAAHLLGS
jgi:hypothetical protein